MPERNLMKNGFPHKRLYLNVDFPLSYAILLSPPGGFIFPTL
jgi:hypothetical protein